MEGWGGFDRAELDGDLRFVMGGLTSRPLGVLVLRFCDLFDSDTESVAGGDLGALTMHDTLKFPGCRHQFTRKHQRCTRQTR